MDKKDKIAIDNLKAHFKQDLDGDGDKIILTIEYNKELQNLLKEVCLNEINVFESYLGVDDESGERVDIILKRQKVKRIIYGGIYSDYKEFLFLEDLYKKGKAVLTFGTLRKVSDFKEYFRKGLKRLIEIWGSVTLKQEIVFRVENPTTEPTTA